MKPLLDFSFAHNYACELLEELPGEEKLQRLFFPGTSSSGRDGLLVRVEPRSGEPWIGMFAFGKVQTADVGHVLSMPDPEKLCVVARGAGYVVVAKAPGSWEPVRAVPIMDVRAVPFAGIVVFATLTDMVAHGQEGARWRTKRLAWDGFRVVDVTERSIIGEYWDIRSEANQRFEVDLATGAQRGGVES